MRNQLATLAVTALLVAPFTAAAETMMPGDSDSGSGMQDS